MIREIPSTGPAFARRPGSPFVRSLLAAVLACVSLAAQATDLQVNPILVEFAPGEQTQALRLTNSGTETLKAQIRVSRWTQQDGQESLQPSRDLVASPAILEIPAGQEQLIRLIRPRVEPLQAEAAYRLTVDELPHDRSKTPGKEGIQFLLRYSIPAFVLAEGTSPLGPTRQTAASAAARTVPTLAARLQPQGKDSLLSVSNPGRQRIRLSALAWVNPSGQRIELVPGLVGYVLAGQRMQWTISLPARAIASGGSLRARFNDDPTERTLPLEGAGG